METTLNIHLGGRVFVIEQPAYNALKSYLDAIEIAIRHEADNRELLQEIEQRIADKFFAFEKQTDKKVIPLEWVEQAKAEMGDPSVFGQGTEEPQPNNSFNSNFGHKKLCKDTNNSMIGGVAAGVGRYFDIDPTIVRIVWAVSIAFGIGALLYGILWIVLPECNEASNFTQKTRLYRDPVNKKIAGVASGLSAYLGIDVIWIRIGFLVSVSVAGVGLLVYIICWAVLPEPNSLMEYMEMKGESPNLENLNKRNYYQDEFQNRNGSNNVGNFFNGIGSFFRIALGIFILIFAGSMLISGTAFLVGITSILSGAFADNNFTFFTESQGLDQIAGISIIAFFVCLGLSLVVFGLRMITGNFGLYTIPSRILSGISGASIVVVLVAIGISFPKFKSQKTVSDVEILNSSSKEITIDLKEIDGPFKYELKRANILPATDSILKIEFVKTAHGMTMEEAEKNAKNIASNYSFQNNTLTLSESIQLKSKAPFRIQRGEVTVFVPKGYKVKFLNDAYAQTYTPVNKTYDWGLVDANNGYTYEMGEKGLIIRDQNGKELPLDDDFN